MVAVSGRHEADIQILAKCRTNGPEFAENQRLLRSGNARYLQPLLRKGDLSDKCPAASVHFPEREFRPVTAARSLALGPT